MWIIVGLGNPGLEYAGTRHNVGFAVIDALAAANGCTLRRATRLSAVRGTCTIADRDVILAKPTTYMNDSGRAVVALIRHFAIPHSSLLIVHDDLDLPTGTLRLSNDGSSGGQKGVQSIIDALGTTEFLRLRIGIGPNATRDGHRIPAEDFVLKKFSPEERPRIDSAVARSINVITVLLRDDFPAAQQHANLA